MAKTYFCRQNIVGFCDNSIRHNVICCYCDNRDTDVYDRVCHRLTSSNSPNPRRQRPSDVLLVQDGEKFIAQRDVSQSKRDEAFANTNFRSDLGQREFISKSVTDSGIDVLHALAVRWCFWLTVVSCASHSGVREMRRAPMTCRRDVFGLTTENVSVEDGYKAQLTTASVVCLSWSYKR